MMQLDLFQDLFTRHEINKKKISALLNYSESLDSFEDWCAVEFIFRWFDRGFLDREGEQFLDYLLKKNGIEFLSWCYKTPWVKRQIASRRKNQAAFVFQETEDDRINTWRKWGLPLKSRPYRVAEFNKEEPFHGERHVG